MTKKIQYTYTLSKETKTTRHYLIDHSDNENQVFSDRIRISHNRKFNNSPHDYFVHERNNPNRWNKTTTTGLMRTNKPNQYEGDIIDSQKRKQHKVLFEFIGDTLLVDVHLNYFRL